MLVLDSTIGCIEASESEVLELHRSAPVVKPSSTRAKPETWEAYVCAIKKKARVTVYLSLVVDDKRIYVYTGTVNPDGDEEYRATVQLALDCAQALGFSPKPVDLSYSPAMREVVVRNTKILRLPGSKAKNPLKHGTAGGLPLPIARAAKESPLQPADAAPISPPFSPSVPAAPTIPADAPAAELPATEGTPDFIELQNALAELQKELESVAAQRDLHSEQLLQLSAQHREISGQLTGARKENARLTAQQDQLAQQQQESERLLGERDALDSELKELAELHQKVVAELAQARDEHDGLREEREALLRQAEGAEKASADLLSLQKEIAELSRQHEEANRRLGESEAGHAAQAEALERARREVAQLTAERDAAQKSAEAGDAVRAEALAQARREVAQLTAERDAAQKSAEAGDAARAEALAQARREVAQLTAERDAALKSAEASDTASRAAGAELEALRRELAAARAEREEALARLESLKEQVAAAEAKTLRQEPKLPGAELQPPPPSLLADDDTAAPLDVPDFEDFTAVQDAAPPFQALEFPTFGESAAEFSPVPETAPSAPLPKPAPELQSPFDQAPESTTFAGFQGDFSGAAADDEQVRFMLEPQLTAVECNCAEDVLELQQSINQVNLTPDGTGQESCRGYICCLRKGDSREVFTAIHGAQSGRTWIYLPEVQPQDEAEYSRIVRGAVSFAEEVGLLMEQVKLDPAPPQRHKRLKQCPALRITGQK